MIVMQEVCRQGSALINANDGGTRGMRENDKRIKSCGATVNVLDGRSGCIRSPPVGAGAGACRCSGCNRAVYAVNVIASAESGISSQTAECNRDRDAAAEIACGQSTTIGSR